MSAIRNVAILGGGTAGWMAAAALAQALRNSRVAIHLVESDDIGAIGVGEATVPDIQWFNSFLGLDEAEFMRECQATMKLGIEFVNWGALGHRYMHPFTASGVDPGRRQFHRLYLKYAHTKRAHETVSFDDFNLGSVAARAGRFSLGQPPPSAAGSLNYAYHFDAALYARYLRRFAERHGVTRTEGKVVMVDQNGESGFIESFTLDSGAKIVADLFIDCSGFAGVLIERTLETGYEEWGHWLPCNRAIAVPSENVEPPIPYTRSTADLAGWIWRIPLQNRVGNGYVYCSQHLSDDDAEARLLSQLQGRVLAEPRRIRFVTGKRKRIWNRNCVALGLAGGFLEPLESTSLHLIQSSVFRLVRYFPDKGFEPVEIKAFNEQTDEEYSDIRDFIITHYKLTSRNDTAFWADCRDMAVPERVSAIIDLFAAKGRLPPKPEQLFSMQSWLSILHGQGPLPRGYDPLLAEIPDDLLRREMDSVRSQIKAAVDAMPTHEAFLRAYCPAPQTTQ